MRKTLTVTITEPANSRDLGKSYLLTEMSATQAEKWAARAFLALAKSGVDIPEDISGAGFAGIAVLGIKALAGVSFADAEPLMDEMFRCIQSVQPAGIRPLVDDDIEEIQTRLKLRKELIGLHTDFFSAAGT